MGSVSFPSASVPTPLSFILLLDHVKHLFSVFTLQCYSSFFFPGFFLLIPPVGPCHPTQLHCQPV